MKRMNVSAVIAFGSGLMLMVGAMTASAQSSGGNVKPSLLLNSTNAAGNTTNNTANTTMNNTVNTSNP